ncbi:Fragile X mental retardation syndrome-related protein [Caligus rogercresseyi]|uniref:Fragile X mental retardation syndrome-related protein n=1 Tax=Caligus rogercresseyi TaxID=217165 RepID=A0A7T8JW41_CALRO|nr:Fragile X mental retardation syndrome-related protein [Caligus rogercresseyi]
MSTDEDTQRKAAMIRGMHFRNSTQKVLKSKNGVERHLEATRIQSTYSCTEKFHVPSELMGLAIGAHGANIQQPGVWAVSSAWSSRKIPRPFVSRGTTRSASEGEEAPRVCRGHESGPQSLVGKVIGRNGGSFRRSWTRVGSFESKYKQSLLRHGKAEVTKTLLAMVLLPAINSSAIKKWYDNVLQVLVKVGKPGAA